MRENVGATETDSDRNCFLHKELRKIGVWSRIPATAFGLFFVEMSVMMYAVVPHPGSRSSIIPFAGSSATRGGVSERGQFTQNSSLGSTIMTNSDWNRRDFSKWTMAAFGGLMAGTVAGCSKEDPAPQTGSTPGTPTPAGDAAGTTEVAAHACRGLNDCKGADHDCAGQSACATVAWHHDCAGQNECKGQGGCGDNALKNDCKGKGGCHIPLMDKVWDQARKDFEARRQSASLAFGDAPAKK